jgi:hypothetical protein
MVLPPGYSLWLFSYKPFLWCRSNARLRHACCSFIFYKPFMWCRPDARLRHYYSCSFLSRSHSDPRLAPSTLLWIILFFTTCVHHGFSYFSWQACDHIVFRSTFDILYPCSKCLRVHSNVLTGLSLAIVLARFLAWRRALRWQPRYLRSVDSSLAKIGVILVSCSCGKWSPIDTDEPQTASAINH